MQKRLKQACPWWVRSAGRCVSRLSVPQLQSLDDVLTSIRTVVRSTINTHRLPNRLPPELLSYIFQFIPQPCYVSDRYAPFASFTRTEDLLPVTHVCRHWRQTALSTPRLWHSISSRAPRNVSATFSQRSKAVPLSIVVRATPSADFCQGVMQMHSGRLQALYASVNFDDKIGGLMDFPAPNLEVLLLHSNASASSTHQPRPITLCRGELPRLKFLSLHQCPIRPANAFPNLTHLNISHQSMGSIAGLLSFFSSAPRLTQLILVNLSTSMASVDTNGPKVTLDHMRDLAMVHIAPDFVSAILSQLILPANMAIQLDHMRVPAGSFFHNLPRIAALEAATKLCVEGTRSRLTVTAAGAASAVRMKFDVDSGHPSLLDAEWLSSLMAALPLARCTELWWLDGLVPCPSLARLTVLRQTLSSMPALTELVLFDTVLQGVRSLIESLHISSTPALGLSGALLQPAPALSTLRLLMLGTVLPPAVEKLAADRAYYGIPLQHLILELPHKLRLSEEQKDILRTLQALVGSVDIVSGGGMPAMPLPPVCYDAFSYWGCSRVW